MFFGSWWKTGAPGGNLHRHRSNVQNSSQTVTQAQDSLTHSISFTWTSTRLTHPLYCSLFITPHHNSLLFLRNKPQPYTITKKHMVPLMEEIYVYNHLALSIDTENFPIALRSHPRPQSSFGTC